MSLSPLLCNAVEITTYKEGQEEYVMLRFFFKQNIPKSVEGSFLPPIEFIPAATIVMTRNSYKSVAKKFREFIAVQEEHRE